MWHSLPFQVGCTSMSGADDYVRIYYDILEVCILQLRKLWGSYRESLDGRRRNVGNRGRYQRRADCTIG